MNVVIFADLHGRILLCLKLVARLQKELNLEVDYILQCGDMGIFPVINKLDKATIRHSLKDDSELGFNKYFINPHQEVLKVLQELSCEIVCVRGNHEDHAFLDKLEQASKETRFSVDCYQKIFVCKSGHLQVLQKGDERLNVVGIGRIGSRVKGNDDRVIQEGEKRQINKLAKSVDSVDLLISHDSPKGFYNPEYGMAELNWVLDNKRPSFHFFGHVGGPFEERKINAFTTCYKLAELEWKHQNSLPPGCIVLLQWHSKDQNKISIIREPWLKEYTKEAWMYL